jgi:hypothetical protein
MLVPTLLFYKKNIFVCLRNFCANLMKLGTVKDQCVDVHITMGNAMKEWGPLDWRFFNAKCHNFFYVISCFQVPGSIILYKFSGALFWKRKNNLLRLSVYIACVDSFVFWPVVVRKLQDFESPYISLKYANKVGSHRIVLRKR